jgi:hypothetical protein
MASAVYPQFLRPVVFGPLRRSVGAFSTVVMLSSLVHCASAGPQVQDCEDQGDDYQHVAQGRTFTELEFVEGQVVGLRRDGLGGIGGPTVGEAQDDVQHLERVDDAEHQNHAHHWPQHGPRDVPEGLPPGGAVQ